MAARGKGTGKAGRLGLGGAGRGNVNRAGTANGEVRFVCEEVMLITDLSPRGVNITTVVQAVLLGGSGVYDINVPGGVFGLSLQLHRGLFYQVEVCWEILAEDDNHTTWGCTLLRIIQLLGSRRGFLNMITVYDEDSESMESPDYDDDDDDADDEYDDDL